jgi:arsenate reductase-like glutaredoxin family protein
MSLAADLLIFANLNSLQGLKSIALSMIARNIEKLSNCKETNAKRLYELLKKNDDSSSSSSLFDELLEHSAQCRRCPIGELKVQSRKRKLLD